MLPGVTNVNWLDDVVGKDVLLTTPIELIDNSVVKRYYKNEKALLNITIQSGGETIAVDAIRDLIGEENALAGEAVNSATTQGLAMTEVLKSMAILVPIILLILFVPRCA